MFSPLPPQHTVAQPITEVVSLNVLSGAGLSGPPALYKDRFLTLAHLFGTIRLKHSATLILLPLLKPPSRCTCLIIISKLFFTAMPIPSYDMRVSACVCVCVVSVIVKCPVLPPYVVDGLFRNPLYYTWNPVKENTP